MFTTCFTFAAQRGNAQHLHSMYILHRKCCTFAGEYPSPLKHGPDKTAQLSFESPLFDPEVVSTCSHTHTHTHIHVYCNGFAKRHLRCASFLFRSHPPPPLAPPLTPLSSLAAAHSQSARITPRSDLQGNNFEVQMGENIISTGLTPDPVAVARLPDASQRLESSVSGDLPLLQTWRWVWRRGSRLYALGERTARVIYLKRHTVTRGARAV